MKVQIGTLVLLALAACTGGESGETAQVHLSMPSVWGPETLKDPDPEPNVVEVHRYADQTRVWWFDNGNT